MAFTDKLKSVFGWGTPSTRVRRREPDVADAYQPKSPVDEYHDMMETRKARRRDRYDVYDAMDKMADVSSILDAYSEDCCQTDYEHEATVWIEGDDKKTVEELTTMFKRVKVEDWIDAFARDVGKYGDDFARVVADESKGVTSLEWRNPRDIERIENREGILLGFETSRTLPEYVRKLQENPRELPTFKPWDVLHTRLFREKRLPHENYRNIYGTSLLSGSDRIAKQTKILDDLLMIIRLTRSLDRRIYYVDTGRSPVEEEVRILKRWRRALKRKTYIDPSTGRFDSRFNPYAWTEDEFWPVKENTNSRVENIEGLGSVGEMVDIEHFRDKFFGSFRAPKAYFGYEGDINAKATLSSQSIRWARAVNALQRAVKQGLTRLCQIHLAYRNMDADAEKFRVMMVVPSVVELLDRLESWQVIIDVAERLATLGETLGLDRLEWTEYILSNTLWLSKDEVKKFVRLLKKAAKGDDPQMGPPDDDDDDEKEPPKPPEEAKRERLQEIDAAIARVAKSRRPYGAASNELPSISKQ